MRQSAQEPVAIPVATEPLRIAVVEDNADNRDFVAEVLRMRGHRVSTAEDGVRGVELILDGGVDVALVDIGLPGWDGYEVACRLRADPSTKGVLLIALTGYGRGEDAAKARAAGFDAFLVKPFDAAAFDAVVAQLRNSGQPTPIIHRAAARAPRHRA